jgi:hypothetical protein
VRFSASYRCPERRSNDGQRILKPARVIPESHSDLEFPVELWGFEPQTSCMPSSGNPSTRVSLCRSPSRSVHPGPPASGPVAVLSCCTTRCHLPRELSARTPITSTAYRSAESCPGQRQEMPCPHAPTLLIGRIECTSVMSGLGGAPAALPGVDAGRCRRRTGRGSGRCGGTAGPRSGRPGRGGVGPFAWVPADLGYGGREARRSSIWRASPSARVARRPPGEWRRARRRSGLAGKGKELLVPRLHP